MAGAFQRTAFQGSAFQTGTSTVVTPQPRGAGGHLGKWRRRESGIYWPRKTKRKDEKEIVAEVLAEALEQVPVAEVPHVIDVGMLATSLIETYGYTDLRRIQTHEEMIRVIKRELEEQDDEDVIMLLF